MARGAPTGACYYIINQVSGGDSVCEISLLISGGRNSADNS